MWTVYFYVYVRFTEINKNYFASPGTLTSITNFASSVSRNMEKLSLDGEYCERQEEGRRHKPDGLSQGLKNGLTGFGLSLLGMTMTRNIFTKLCNIYVVQVTNKTINMKIYNSYRTSYENSI